MAWSDAAREAAAEARRMHAKRHANKGTISQQHYPPFRNTPERIALAREIKLERLKNPAQFTNTPYARQHIAWRNKQARQTAVGRLRTDALWGNGVDRMMARQRGGIKLSQSKRR